MRVLTVGIAGLLLAACTTAPQGALPPESAEAALAPYYASLPDSLLPRAPAGQSLPAAETTLRRILVGSCNNEEMENPTLAQIAREEADLFLMVGDNVYGDMNGRAYLNNQPDLDELRASFAEFASRPEFQAVRAAHPMMVTWDDHDYGANDAGANFPFRGWAERIHETFWGLEDTEAASHDGVHYAKTFGPEGRRTQVIMLDTRFHRADLKQTPEWGAPGMQRYIPLSDSEPQAILGEAQWAWLADRLREPADLRLIVSSIQVLTTDGHGFEHWNLMPKERDRLYALVGETGADGVVFVSGDRHVSFLYRKDDVLPYPVHELTASSLNADFVASSDERDSAQIGDGFTGKNFGAIETDWEMRTVTLSIHDESGARMRSVSFPIPVAPAS